MAPTLLTEAHPLVTFGIERAWSYEKTARFFGFSYGLFRQVVRGFRGVSVTRADRIEKKSHGEIKSIDLLRWHGRNRRGVA